MSSVPIISNRMVDPTETPAIVRALSRWHHFIGSVATGITVQDAMLKHLIKRSEIEAICRSNKQELKKYREAVLAGLRSAYSEMDLDELFNRVAMGLTINEAFVEVFGREITPTFYKLLREDTDLEERYQTALKTKATLEVEKVLEIVDETSNDTLDGPKGGEIPNMAAVQRSRLRADTRMALAGRWYRRLFGEDKDQTQVTVNVNLAERLERGIQRLRGVALTQQERSEAIDAEVVPVVVQKMDTSWMDEKPNETIWREES